MQIQTCFVILVIYLLKDVLIPFSVLTVFLDPSDTCTFFFKDHTLLELNKVIQHICNL